MAVKEWISDIIELLKLPLDKLALIAGFLFMVLSFCRLPHNQGLKFEFQSKPIWWLLVPGVFFVVVAFYCMVKDRVLKSKNHTKDTKKEKNKNEESNISENEFIKTTKRICFLCSTTKEIEISVEQANGLRRFYEALLEKIYRTTYGINTCGAEPFRNVIFKHYCDKLANSSKPQMNQLQDRIRWYWFASDTVGWNVQPPFYNSVETGDHEERTLKEIKDSDIIIAFTGRLGGKMQLERILNYHKRNQHGVDLEQKTPVILCWFGGAVEEFFNQHRSELNKFLNKYTELEPDKRVREWWVGDMPEKLADRLVNFLPKLID